MSDNEERILQAVVDAWLDSRLDRKDFLVDLINQFDLVEALPYSANFEAIYRAFLFECGRSTAVGSDQHSRSDVWLRIRDMYLPLEEE